MLSLNVAPGLGKPDVSQVKVHSFDFGMELAIAASVPGDMALRSDGVQIAWTEEAFGSFETSSLW